MAVRFQLERQAHVAHFAVEEIVSAANAANAAAVAMILILIFVVEQIANETCVLGSERERLESQIAAASEAYLPEPDPASLALGLHLLARITICTNQLCQRFPVEVMILVLIMAKPTLVKLSTTRRLKFVCFLFASV